MSALRHEAVLAAAAAGDDAALSQLVHAYHDRVYRFGLRVCRDGFDADDAVQEAFLQLARRPDVAKDQGALSWLFTVVKNACLRMLRPFVRERRALGERLADVDEASVIDPAQLDPQQALERWELVQSVHAAIASLDRPLREVLVLRDLEGLSGEETSTALGVELAAMKSRLHKARAQLREALQSAPRAVTKGSL